MGNCQPADVPFVIISSVHLWGEIALRYNIDWNIKSFLWHQETWVTILFCRDKWHSSCIPVAFLSPGYLFWRSKLSWGPERRPVNSWPISKWGGFTEIHRRSMKIYCMSCGMDFWSWWHRDDMRMTYGWPRSIISLFASAVELAPVEVHCGYRGLAGFRWETFHLFIQAQQ